ncbi:unnamed protein product [Caenorhabditis brenneri]
MTTLRTSTILLIALILVPAPVLAFSISSVIMDGIYPLLIRCASTGAFITVFKWSKKGPVTIASSCLLIINMCIDYNQMIEFNQAGEPLLKRNLLFAKLCMYGGGIIGEMYRIPGVFGSIIGGFGGEAALKVLQGFSWIASFLPK